MTHEEQQALQAVGASRRDRRTRLQRARAFQVADETYERFRPEYPEAIVSAVAARAPHGGHVVDCGAGTGKFTRLLAARGLDITAIEPAAAMADQLRRTCDTPPLAARVRVEQARGEETGLPESCADVVTYAQAWHWVDEQAAAAEAARILRPDGTLALIWNQFATDVPWVHRLTRIMRSGDVHLTRGYRDLPPYFGVPERITSSFSQRLLPDEVMALARTRSSYLAASAATRARMQDNLRWYLRDHLGYGEADPIELPYTCVAWLYRRD
ncbi:class I SAM-dependent methyltransferase [Bowdeniella nasicola]|uniref:class I SAM-dependent methyltransferase n=1 Tax=Bowdeniella nasicola TaxID=208480 RepID=UPI000B850256|nr:class I SAM-dependent methyltransferase [Bowdeniella nasicola]